MDKAKKKMRARYKKEQVVHICSWETMKFLYFFQVLHAQVQPLASILDNILERAIQQSHDMHSPHDNNLAM